MTSKLVLLCPEGISRSITEFRDNFSFSEEQVDSTPAFINVFSTFVALKDINRALNRVSRAQVAPVTLNFDQISYRQVDEETWSVIYKMSDESAFKDLWNQFLSYSGSQVIRENPVVDAYLHITNCSFEEIVPMQEIAQEELGCLCFEVNELAAFHFGSELTLERRKFRSSTKPASSIVVEAPRPRSFKENIEEKSTEAVSYPASVACESESEFNDEPIPDPFATQVQAKTPAAVEKREVNLDRVLADDYTWNTELENFGTRGYYRTLRTLTCQTKNKNVKLQRGTIVLVQNLKFRKAEITVPHHGWVDFTEEVMTPMWKPELRPGVYRTTCTVEVTHRNKVKTIPANYVVRVQHTKQLQSLKWNPAEQRKTFQNNGKMLDQVFVTCTLKSKGKKPESVRGYVRAYNSKNQLVLKYANRCFFSREFQDVKVVPHSVRAVVKRKKNLSPVFKPFPEVAESVVSEASALTVSSGVSSFSSGSFKADRQTRKVTKTGNVFGQPGIYKLLGPHNIFDGVNSKSFVQDKKFDKKTKQYVEKDALIRQGQLVSVLEVRDGRAKIVAPYEGWISFSRDYAALVVRKVRAGEVHEIRARKKTLVLNANSYDGLIVDKLKRGTRVKVEKFEGSSALITYPVYGWIDIVGAALNKSKAQPKLILSEVPWDMVNCEDGSAKIQNLLENCGIPVFVQNKFGRTRTMVRAFVNKPRRIFKGHSRKEFVYAPSTTVSLIFNSVEDAEFAVHQDVRLKTHQLPLSWSHQYKTLSA